MTNPFPGFCHALFCYWGVVLPYSHTQRQTMPLNGPPILGLELTV